ncbi:uncharacterized protein LOC121754848 [Salvia splendens]|uniref:uncharacterized protein LOC121754848 n=1 Tax=Salvia splendens TaxID=180675 RepID=UPI001C27A680|nr:uncharacterized protein LOC121754848 [Salvia splendens]
MGKRLRFHRCEDSRLQHRTKQMSQNLVWVPKIPKWEREFCYKIGSFTWENFIEAKKQTRFSYKIMDWNDYAAKEAFLSSKNRFFATINGSLSDSDDLNPDLYIDEIHWDEPNGHDDGFDMPSISDTEDEDEDEEANAVDVSYWDFKPTGWECDCKDERLSEGKDFINR